ncbi:MAG: anthranilate synthase component I [Anaerolineae bacterium]
MMTTDAQRGRGPRLLRVRELTADLETPVSVYLKLGGRGPSFLLESVEGGERLGRYSFIGLEPDHVLTAWREHAELADGQGAWRQVLPRTGLYDLLRQLLAQGPPPLPGLPSFTGGAVGYLGYDVVRDVERLPLTSADPLGLPEVVLLFCSAMVILDHVKRRLWVTAQAPVLGSASAAEALAEARIADLVARLQAPLPAERATAVGTAMPAQPSMSREAFEAAVRRAKEYIAAGDIFQVVLSRRLVRPTSASPLAIYRALRRLNPSPYLFFLDLPGDLRLIGSSPEVLVRLQGRQAEVRPLAGTRPRGRDAAEDAALEGELLADVKERAEHVMLVDLARNDLGRVCRYGSISVPTLMEVERYSHVMHIVSQVQGELLPGCDAIDLLKATFPAGTVSGAPKVRAMEIIEELEGLRRGPYAGAVGHLDYGGGMDVCIAIRTIVMQGQTAYLQAGAGIVADSDPAREFDETANKLRAQEQAIAMAEEELQDAGYHRQL